MTKTLYKFTPIIKWTSSSVAKKIYSWDCRFEIEENFRKEYILREFKHVKNIVICSTLEEAKIKRSLLYKGD